MPAEVRYASLKAAVADEAEIHLKDLEVYATETPRPDYEVDQEVDAIGAFADSLGLDRCHLVAYSGGGFVSLAYTGLHPDRVLSLAVFEPAWLPGERGAEERDYWAKLEAAVSGKTGPEFTQSFMRVQTRPEVELPPPSGPPPPWMGKRPLGLMAMMAGFSRYRFDRGLFAGIICPVLYGYGDQSATGEDIKLPVLSRVLPDLHIRRFAGVNHFVPPEKIYNPEHVAALRDVWGRAEPPT